MRRGIRKALPVAVGVLLLACGLTLAWGKEPVPDQAPESAPGKVPSLAPGAAAPAFRLPDALGMKFSFGEAGGERRRCKGADAYRVTEIPTLFLVDRGGKVTFAGTGRVAEETLEKAVQAVLQKQRGEAAALPAR